MFRMDVTHFKRLLSSSLNGTMKDTKGVSVAISCSLVRFSCLGLEVTATLLEE